MVAKREKRSSEMEFRKALAYLLLDFSKANGKFGMLLIFLYFWRMNLSKNLRKRCVLCGSVKQVSTRNNGVCPLESTKCLIVSPNKKIYPSEKKNSIVNLMTTKDDSRCNWNFPSRIV